MSARSFLPLDERRERPSRFGIVVAIIAGSAVVADLFTHPFPSDPPVPWVVVGAGALVFLTLAWPRVGPLWVRFGSFYAAFWIALLLGATGGTRSPYIYLYAILLILAAVNHTPGALWLLGVVAVAGAVSPVLYDPTFAAPYLQDLALNAMFAFVVAFAVQRLLSELASNEERFRLLADNAQDVVYRVDLHPEPHLSYVSPAVERLTGYTPDELRNGTSFWHDVVVEEDRPIFEELVKAPPMEPRRVTVRVRHRDGDVRWVEDRLSTAVNEQGQPVAIEGIFRDVTERVEAQAAVKASESQFRSLAEQSSDVIYRYRLRPVPGFEYVNSVAEVVTGFPLARIKEDPGLAWERIHPDDRAHHAEVRRDLGRLREPVTVRWHRRDGTWIWLEERLTPVYDGEGEVVAVNAVVRDVTPQKELEERLHATIEDQRVVADQLRAVNELKDAFLQAVSHELRTPLTSVVGYAHTLRIRHNDLTGDQVGVLLDRLVDNAEKLQRLLTNLLDVDRLSKGHVGAIRGRVDLGQLVCRVVSEADTSKHPVELDVDRVIAHVDAPKTERIVENLLVNAIRHTPVGTKVRIRLRKEGDAAHLVVEDEGDGVPAELRQSIFEPFRQGPAAAEEASPGTGIGLALVARLVELHGGRVWVEDGAAGGAAFHVLLPDEDETADSDAGGVAAGGGAADLRQRRPAATDAVVPVSPTAGHTS